MYIETIEKDRVQVTKENFVFHVYDEVVHVIRTIRKKGFRPRKDEWLISRAEFEQNKHRRTLNWAIGKRCLAIATPAYMKFYKGGCRGCFREEAYEPIETWHYLLTAGVSDRIIERSSKDNGFLYDVKGDVIPRGLFFDYIHGGLISEKYRVDDLLLHLQSHPEVQDAQIIDVPGYNGGGRAVEFLFVTNDQSFRRLYKKNKKSRYFSCNCWELRDSVFRRVKLFNAKSEMRKIWRL